MSKLMILGGANVHSKLVDAAKKENCTILVADYLPDSPAKMLADEAFMADIRDVNSLEKICRHEKVDAVLSTHLDPGQRPYQQLCERLGLPCFCTADQVFRMTDKRAFKKMCRENGVDVIEEYSEEDVQLGMVSYPVFVKPVDSRGSRGQTVCRNREEAMKAIELARTESSNNDVLIERYMEGAQELQVTYFFVDGKANLIRIADSYGGDPKHQMEKVVACAVSPSKYTDEYMRLAHEKVVKMFESMGFQNGPIFMQGFYDQGKFRFFDPGVRFPGVEYEKIYPELFQLDLMRWMVYFSLNGFFPAQDFPDDLYRIKGKSAAVLFPTIKAGTIGSISGIEELSKDQTVISMTTRYKVGDIVPWSYNVNQRFAEIVILCDDENLLKQKIMEIQCKLKVLDTNGQSMTFERFDTKRIGG